MGNVLFCETKTSRVKTKIAPGGAEHTCCILDGDGVVCEKMMVKFWIEVITANSLTRPSLCSQTSTNDAPTVTLSRSHIREPYRTGRASPLQQEPPEESDARASVYRSEREDTPPTSLVGSGKLGAGVLSRYKRKASRDMIRSRERTVANERRRTERQEQMEFLHRCEREVVRIAEMAKQQVAATEDEKNSGWTSTSHCWTSKILVPSM